MNGITVKMKKLIYIRFLLIILILIIVTTAVAYAQVYKTEVIKQTKVGSPVQTQTASCPIPSGKISCGSKFTPINGCGHCGLAYESYMNNCTYDAINYAIDVEGNAGESIYLPSINGKSIAWTFREEQACGSGSCQIYTGIDEQTKDQYYIRFHHTEAGSGVSGKHTSGTIGARVCLTCKSNNHVHVELGSGDPTGNQYLDAAQYLCR